MTDRPTRSRDVHAAAPREGTADAADAHYDELSPFGRTAPDAVARREDWIDAVYASDLKPLERFVAVIYEKFAGNGTDGVWVAFQTLLDHTGLSRDAANRAIRGLREKGWLYQTERGRQHRAARVRLILPSSTGDVLLNGGEVIHSPALSGTADVPLESQQYASRHSAVRLAYPNPKEPLDLTSSSSVSHSGSVPREGARAEELPPALAQRAASLGIEPGAIVRAVHKHTGRMIPLDQAVVFATDTIGRAAGPVLNGTGYVIRSAADHPEEVIAFLDGRRPPHVSEDAWSRALGETPASRHIHDVDRGSGYCVKCAERVDQIA